jgi:hypothetical protein
MLRTNFGIVPHRRGTGRALGTSAALDLFLFPIGEAMAEPLGRLRG